MTQFEPRKVSWEAPLSWLREALSIATGRWPYAVLVVTPILLLAAQMPKQAVIFSLPLVVAGLLFFFVALAAAYDTNGSLLHLLRALAHRLFLVLGFVAMVEILAAAMWGFGARSSADIAQAFLNAERSFSEFPPGSLALLMLVPGWILLREQFFILGLLVDARLPFWEAYELSRRGHDVNSRVVFVVTLVGAASNLLLAGVQGLFAVVVIPITAAFMYVAYRDVFLHKSESGHAAAKSATVRDLSVPAPDVPL